MAAFFLHRHGVTAAAAALRRPQGENRIRNYTCTTIIRSSATPLGVRHLGHSRLLNCTTTLLVRSFTTTSLRSRPRKVNLITSIILFLRQRSSMKTGNVYAYPLSPFFSTAATFQQQRRGAAACSPASSAVNISRGLTALPAAVRRCGKGVANPAVTTTPAATLSASTTTTVTSSPSRYCIFSLQAGAFSRPSASLSSAADAANPPSSAYIMLPPSSSSSPVSSPTTTAAALPLLSLPSSPLFALRISGVAATPALLLSPPQPHLTRTATAGATAAGALTTAAKTISTAATPLSPSRSAFLHAASPLLVVLPPPFLPAPSSPSFRSSSFSFPSAAAAAVLFFLPSPACMVETRRFMGARTRRQREKEIERKAEQQRHTHLTPSPSSQYHPSHSSSHVAPPASSSSSYPPSSSYYQQQVPPTGGGLTLGWQLAIAFFSSIAFYFGFVMMMRLFGGHRVVAVHVDQYGRTVDPTTGLPQY